MDESTFISSIRCRFPYEDRARALDLANQACSLCLNAAFAVVDEISRPPVGESAAPELSEEVLLLIEQRLSHPLVQPILAVARKLVAGQSVSVSESVLVLRQVERFPGQYCALSVAYFACDDVDDVADQEFNRIVAAWDAI